LCHSRRGGGRMGDCEEPVMPITENDTCVTCGGTNLRPICADCYSPESKLEAEIKLRRLREAEEAARNALLTCHREIGDLRAELATSLEEAIRRENADARADRLERELAELREAVQAALDWMVPVIDGFGGAIADIQRGLGWSPEPQLKSAEHVTVNKLRAALAATNEPPKGIDVHTYGKSAYVSVTSDVVAAAQKNPCLCWCCAVNQHELWPVNTCGHPCDKRLLPNESPK
jgi:hypothetical protein